MNKNAYSTIDLSTRRSAQMGIQMKILLVGATLNAGVILEEIGICLIAAVLRENGYEVKIISSMAKDIDMQEIVLYNPDIIGFSTYNQTMPVVEKMCKSAKENLKSVYTILGGNTATFYAKDILEENKSIDYVILGEGEITFLELANVLSGHKGISSVQGIAYRDNGIVKFTEARDLVQDLDELPFASRDLIKKHNLRIAMIAGSRGCTHNCYFCSSNRFWRHNNKFKWRGRSPQNIVDELEYLNKAYHIKQFWFTDPSFEDPGFNESRMREIAGLIIKRNLKISYIIYVRAAFYKNASDELMELLIRSGLCSVFVGTEAVNAYDLKVYGKAATIEDNLKAIQFFKSYNISVEIGFINFNPYSNFEGLRENAKFLYEYKYYTGFYQNSRIMVFKGSRFYDKIKEDKLLTKDTYRELYCYEFLDKRIQNLSEFLTDFFGELEKDTYVFEKISLLTHLYQSRLAHFKRHFCEDETSEISKLIEQHEIKLSGMIDEFNEVVGAWYWKLLDMAEFNWNEEEAVKYSRQVFNKGYLDDLVFRLTHEKMILLKRLSKINREYALFL